MKRIDRIKNNIEYFNNNQNEVTLDFKEEYNIQEHRTDYIIYCIDNTTGEIDIAYREFLIDYIEKFIDGMCYAIDAVNHNIFMPSF